MALKTYVLLDELKPTAPIYVQVSSTQRVRMDTLPQWHPYLLISFLDENKEVTDYDPDSPTFGQKIKNKMVNKNRTIRLKLTSNTPYQDEQIEKEKIPANIPFTNEERNAVKFVNNVLVTNNPVVQNYLEVYPGFNEFKGKCSVDGVRPSYKIYDKNIEVKSENENFKLRLKAANKIAAFDLKEAQDLLIRIFGTFYEVPTDVDAAQNALVAFMDSTDEAINEILKENTTIDDEIQILLGRLVSEGKLSFDAVPGEVAKKKNGQWINLKSISNEYSPEQRQRYFAEFLATEAGKTLHDDLKKEASVKKKEKQLV